MRISENTNNYIVRKGGAVSIYLLVSLLLQVSIWIIPLYADPFSRIGPLMLLMINLGSWPFLLIFFYYLVIGQFHRIIGIVDFNGIRGLDVVDEEFDFQWRQISSVEFCRKQSISCGPAPILEDKDSIILKNGRTVCIFWTWYYDGLNYSDIRKAIEYYSKGNVHYVMHLQWSKSIFKKRKPYEL